MKSKLVNSVHTVAQARAMITRLDEALGGLKEGHELNKYFDDADYELLKDDLRAAKAPLDNKVKTASALEEIKGLLLRKPKMGVTLAFVPSASFMEELASRLERWSKAYPLLAVSFDPTIGGGLIVDFKGRRHDLSLGDEIGTYLKKT